MVYDYDDSSDIPELSHFVDELVEEMLCSALYRHNSQRKFNMLKLPLIMAPCLLRKQINNENLKKTIMEKQFDYDVDTFREFENMVSTGMLKMNQIHMLSVPELKSIGEKLNLMNGNKTVELLKIDLINLSNMLIGGQVLYNLISQGTSSSYFL